MLYTIGYERRTLNEVLTLLCRQPVASMISVIDVRRNVRSRRADFNKRNLEYALCLLPPGIGLCRGIRYESLIDLGPSPALRWEYKQDNDWAVFAEKFRMELSRCPFLVAKLAHRAQVENICLLCYERDASKCHRSIVAEAIVKSAGDFLQVVHL